MNSFTERVISIIRKIPKGRVATYKQVAGLSGKPHASRAVAWILNSCSKKHQLPWQRVLSSKGKISFKPLTVNFRLQKNLLKREGVSIRDSGEIDLPKFQWKKFAKTKPGRKQPRMFS